MCLGHSDLYYLLLDVHLIFHLFVLALVKFIYVYQSCTETVWLSFGLHVPPTLPVHLAIICI